jgi:hypothetical protein
MHHKFNYILLLFLASLWGCSGKKAEQTDESLDTLNHVDTYSANSKPRYSITFEKTASYGSTQNHLVLVGGGANQGQNAKVDDKGRVFIPDRKRGFIAVFARDGRYLTSMGRKGKGPGEFDVIGNLRIGPKYLYANDTFLQRINVFSLDLLAFSHTILMNPSKWEYIKKLRTFGSTNHLFIGKNGRLLLQLGPNLPKLASTNAKQFEKYNQKDYYHYYWMNAHGKIRPLQILKQKAQRRVFTTFRGRPTVFRLPIYSKPLLAVSRDGVLFAARSENFLIKVYDANGNYIRSIHYTYKKVPLHRKTLIKRYDIYSYPTARLSAVKHIKLPKAWPALHSIRLDDQNRLWVSTIVKNQKVYQWWVLNKEGKLLARFTWPRDKPIQDIQNNALYVSVRNKEGVVRIVRYKIQMQ